MDCGRLKNEALDIEIMQQKLQDNTDKHFTIEELCNIYKLKQTDGFQPQKKLIPLHYCF